MELFALAGLVAGGVALAVFTAKSASAGDMKAQPSAGNPVKTTTSEVKAAASKERKPVPFVRVEGCIFWRAKTVDGYDFYQSSSYSGGCVNIQVLWWIMNDREQEEYMRRNPSFVPDQSFEEEVHEVEISIMDANREWENARDERKSRKRSLGASSSSSGSRSSGGILNDPVGFAVATKVYSGGYGGDW